DVVIVGAGPGGLMAAWKAAENGVSVLVLDKKSKIGEPVHCAEGTFLLSLEIFGLHEGPWIANRYEGIVLNITGKRPIRVDAKKIEPVCLDRMALEQEIARRAREAGAEIRTGAMVTGLDDGTLMLHTGESLRPKVIIGADGVESYIGRWAGLIDPLELKDLGSAAQYVMEGGGWDTRFMDTYLGFDIAPGGYAWAFPRSDGQANVGLIVQPNKARASELLEKFLSSKYPGARPIRRTGGCVPAGPPLKRTVKDNILLVGDAARQAFPLSGGGIHAALFSGAVAGKAAAASAEANDPTLLGVYEETWRKCYLKALMRNYLLKERTYGSQKGLMRTARMLRAGAAILNLIPFNPLNMWWGKFGKYV
ncbi:MAG: NAD(P)/FAD-dependent oxidoreductase, partial [Thermoplasmata archaeon]|nr:NAD(P)/FAD-dependent oxidoreductase [Thermoplasmata archaeon]